MSLPVWCFVVGMAAGCGPCFATCAPTIMSYVGGLKQGWREGLAASLAFSLARIPAYLLLGLAVSYLGTRLHEAPAFHALQSGVRILTGVLLIVAGALLALGIGHPRGCCGRAGSRGRLQDIRLLAGLGFLYGLSPCLPMAAVLARVGVESATVVFGAACMALFGLGTVISPLLLIGAGSGHFSQVLARRGALDVFRRACGLLLCYSGALLISGWQG